MSGGTGYSYLLKDTIALALREDIGHGDITSSLLIPENALAEAVIVAKEDFIVAGIPFVSEVFGVLDSSVQVKVFSGEGTAVKKGDALAGLQGRALSILAGERVALNILQRVSGIATLTSTFVAKVKGLEVRIADTRKTAPGMRLMEKYGVAAGGGANHRFGLYDGVLIKDNHIKVAGGVRQAVGTAKKAHHLLKIEVEVKDHDELREALEAGADIIMLDNMSLQDMAEAVRIARGRGGVTPPLLEASGNVTLDNVRSIAETGVDIISIGALTHSARAMDISMKVL
jgi:nicotinate-nucleotide pyrophosphorylase (carboxylating)